MTLIKKNIDWVKNDVAIVAQFHYAIDYYNACISGTVFENVIACGIYGSLHALQY